MGVFDSSSTRVQPVFDALWKQDPSGGSWLRPLLKLGSRAPQVELPRDLGTLTRDPEFELPADPPRSFLSWLIENPEELCAPGEEEWKTWSPETQAKRRALLSCDRQTQDEALVALQDAIDLPTRAWWRLEGVTRVDCALTTRSAVVFIEGKRTELGPSKQVRWYSKRNQILRLLDCALTAARSTERLASFVLLVVERKLLTEDTKRQSEIAAVVEPGVVADSLPHLAPDEREQALRRYLGMTTWQDVVERFGLDPDILRDRVEG